MGKVLYLLFTFTLILGVYLKPIDKSLKEDEDFCKDGSLLNYETGKNYNYKYETTNLLWINDVSDEAKSTFNLKANVVLSAKDNCRLVMKLDTIEITSDAAVDKAKIAAALQANPISFRLNKKGELDSLVRFAPEEETWAKNVKRGIISTLQAKSEGDLRNKNPADKTTEKSAVVYENDVLGRCRTTYVKEDDELEKTKSLSRCTLNENEKDSAVQFVSYKNLPEFYQGQLFFEKYECDSKVKDNVVDSVECKEKSTYKIGGRGSNGVQAVVSQKLTFVSALPGQDRMADVTVDFGLEPIRFDKLTEDLPLNDKNFDIEKFTSAICDKVATDGLPSEHSTNFRDLVIKVRSMDKAALLDLYKKSEAKCNLAGLTVSQAIAFAVSDSENAFDAMLDLLDQDKPFENQNIINEYPILTALGRVESPSKELIEKLNNYLKSKTTSYRYLKKMYLVYSSVIQNYCRKNYASCQASAESWSALLEKNLEGDCSKGELDLVSTSLKAIGNIGFFKNVALLEACAAKKENSNEVRVSALQALRNFDCSKLESFDGKYKLLKEPTEDSEVRINAFRTIMKCSQGARFQKFVNDELKDFLKKEEDAQVFTYVVDFGRERGLTYILNPILADPAIKEKFSVNFKELSWNNYKYKYSVMRDGAIEVDTSVIYTSKSFMPRSINLNVTLHLYGMSINFLDATIRVEGMDDAMKAILLDRLTSEKLLARIMEKPEKLIDILKSLTDKLKFSSETPFFSLAVRVYGSDIFYSVFDKAEKLSKLQKALDIKSMLLYRERNTIRNLFLFDTDVQQPLSNGFIFRTRMNTVASLLLVSQGKRELTGSDVKFDIEKFYSTSVNVDKRLEVVLNNENKLSLKRQGSLSTRLRLDVEGSRETGKSTYKLNLTPKDKLTLFKIQGRFFKLGPNGEYVEITQFKPSTYELSKCTSENFNNAMGVDLCIDIKRPTFDSLVSSLDSSELPGDDDEDNSLEEDGDEDDSNGLPRASLLGPYKYEINLLNKDSIQSVIIVNEYDADDFDALKFKSTLSTVKAGQEQKRLELNYERERVVTNRGLTRGFELKLTNLNKNEIRFDLKGKFVYKKNQELSILFNLDNKILKEFLYSLEVSRVKNEENMIPSYKLESTFKSKLVSDKESKLILNLLCDKNDITSTGLFSMSESGNEFKVFESSLTLKGRNQESTNLDHDLDFTLTTFRGRQIKATGQLKTDMFESNIDLKFTHSLDAEKELNIKIGHKVDLSSKEKSVAFASLKSTSIFNHGIKASIDFDAVNEKLNSVEFEITTKRTGSDSPYIVTFSKSSTYDESKYSPSNYDYVNEYKLRVKNIKFSLTPYSRDFLAKSVIKADGSDVVNEAEIVLKATKSNNNNEKKHDYQLTVKKNNVVVLTINDGYFGDFIALRKSNVAEFPSKKYGAKFDFTFLSYSGSGSLDIGIAASEAANKHDYSISLKFDKFLKAITKIEEVSFSHSSNGNKLSSSFDMKKIGDVKQITVSSTGDLRRSGVTKIDGKDYKNLEYDVTYKKVLASAEEFSAKGVMKAKFVSFKNFIAELDMPSNFGFRLATKNERDGDETSIIGKKHELEFSYKHVDFEPVAKEYKIALNRVAPNTKGIFAVLFKKGLPNQLADDKKLDNLVDLKVTVDAPRSSDRFLNLLPIHMDRTTNLRYKNKASNVEIDFSADYKNNKVESTYIEKLDAKFPIEGGKLNNLVATLDVKSREDGRLTSIKYTRSSESKFFLGQMFPQLSFTYVRNLLNEDKNVPHVKIDVDYLKRSPFNEAVTEKRNINVELLSSCLVGECKDTRIKVKQNASGQPSTFHFEHSKFNKRSGVLAFGLTYSEKEIGFVNKFAYKRELDDATGALNKAKYELFTQFDAQNKKNCTLEVKSGKDYTNVLNCELHSSRSPIPLNYGYALKVEKKADFILFGKRNAELSVQMPMGRLVKVTYKSDRTSPISSKQFDDDMDDNNEREFSSVIKVYPDFKKNDKFFVEAQVKRDNIAPGKSEFSIKLLNLPKFKLLALTYLKERKMTETDLTGTLSYELDNSVKNKLVLRAKMDSDLDTSESEIELSLERPSFNVFYQNKFDKRNGRLKYMSVRLARVLRLVVDKEYDPENRRISLELSSPDDSKFTVETTEENKNSIYTKVSTLKAKGDAVSRLTSSFDSRNNRLLVTVEGLKTNNKYVLDLGVNTEKLATAFLTDAKTNKILGQASLSIKQDPLSFERINNLIFELKWNRMWAQMLKDMTNEEAKVKPNPEFNSYFGDCYAQLQAELKDAYLETRKLRTGVTDDLASVFYLNVDFYSKALPEHMLEGLKGFMTPRVTQDGQKIEDLPLHKRLFYKYNNLADRLTTLSIRLRSLSKSLSRMVPRLPTMAYESSDSYKNSLTLTRPTLYATNLYQFNAEYRDYIKRAGERILSYKNNMMRNINGVGLSGIVNKYKYRSLREHTLVAHVFKSRNLIGFDGEYKQLRSKCKYLLTHDIAKNKFSVVLNFNQENKDNVLTLYANEKAINIGYNKISVDDKVVPLPTVLKLNGESKVTLRKSRNSVCADYNQDMTVCCYEDSQSCSISATRFYTGRLNGLLGRADNDEQPSLDDEISWAVGSCTPVTTLPKSPNEEASKTCYEVFGQHRLSPFRAAFLVVKPQPWQAACERALTVDPKSKCLIMSAFVENAKINKVDVNLPNECFKCENKNLNKQYYLDAEIPKEESSSEKFVKGSDYVFLIMPCDKKEFLIDYTNDKTHFNENSGNRYYAVKLTKNTASIYQSEKQETFNFDLKTAVSTLASEETTEVETETFMKGLLLAESLFANRLAKNRHLIIKSCGNCLPYSIKMALAMSRVSQDLGITVTSMGDYKTTGEKIVAYTNEKVYSKNDKNEIDVDDADSFTFEHEADICHRMAVKTEGIVVNLNEFKEQNLVPKLFSWLDDAASSKKFEVKSCQRLDTPFGDLADFRFRRI